MVREGVKPRIAESLQLALKHGQGLLAVCYLEPEREALLRASESGGNPESFWSDRLFSTLFACPDCGVSFEELEPRTFSFNSPYGACPVCEGLGCRVEFDPELLFPNPVLSLQEGAIAPWKTQKSASVKKSLAEIESFLVTQSLTLATLLPKQLSRGLKIGQSRDELQ